MNASTHAHTHPYMHTNSYLPSSNRLPATVSFCFPE